MTTPTLLITGGSGMIGSLLAEVLADRGVPFRAMLRDPGKSDALARLPDVELVKGDFDSPTTLDAALAGVERAFLLTNSSERTEGQQKAFVAAARRAGVRHVVKLSQLEARADSPVRFLRYHAAVEAAVRDAGLEWTFVRPNLILQAYLPFAPAVAKGVLQAPLGDARVSVVDARDIAAVAAAALTEDGHAGKVYTVTGPAAVTHPEIAAALGAAIGRDVRFESTPAEAFGDALRKAGMSAWQVDGLIEDYAHYARGEAAAASPDVERVTHTKPRSVGDFARDYAAAFVR